MHFLVARFEINSEHIKNRITKLNHSKTCLLTTIQANVTPLGKENETSLAIDFPLLQLKIT